MKYLLVWVLGTIVVGLVTDRLDRWSYALLIGGSLFIMMIFFLLQRPWI